MNDQTNVVTFEHVVEAYLLRREEALNEERKEAGATRDVLAEFMRLYPQYADELMDYAATASIVGHAPVTGRTNENDAAEEDAIVKRGMETAARLLASRRNEPTLPGLRKAAEARGLTMQALAAQTNLSVPVLMKLDRRLIRFASIPREAIEVIARAINHTSQTVTAYLQGERKFATGAAFLAEEAPQMPDQQDFFEAIGKDLTMNETQKEEWSKLKNSSA